MEFQVNGTDCTLYCRQKGSGTPLLLIHGIACDSAYFSETAALLQPYFRVITYDRRGYSNSTAASNASYSLLTQAQDAALVLREAGAGPAFVAGCSAGGLIALHLAAQYPEMVRALFLHEPPLGAAEKDAQAITAWKQELEKDASRQRLTMAMVHFYRAIGGTDPAASPTPLEVQERALENMKVFLGHELEEFLSPEAAPNMDMPFPMPLFLAAGTADAAGLFSRAGKANAARLHAHFLSVPGCHNLPAEQPAQFAQILLETFTKIK